MPATEERVSLTLTLPRDLIDEVDGLAKQNNYTLERELESLVTAGLKSKLSVRERLERLSDAYRARLDSEGKLNQTGEEVMEDLRRIREQVANEFYPE